MRKVTIGSARREPAHDDIPGPGSYDPAAPARTPGRVIHERHTRAREANAVPGPGTYDDPRRIRPNPGCGRIYGRPVPRGPRPAATIRIAHSAPTRRGQRSRHRPAGRRRPWEVTPGRGSTRQRWGGRDPQRSECPGRTQCGRSGPGPGSTSFISKLPIGRRVGPRNRGMQTPEAAELYLAVILWSALYHHAGRRFNEAWRLKTLCS
jgi:hypothetical protein